MAEVGSLEQLVTFQGPTKQGLYEYITEEISRHRHRKKIIETSRLFN